MVAGLIPLGASSTGAIAGGAAAGAALLFAIPAIGFALWRRRKPEEHFFDVPGGYYTYCFAVHAIFVICFIHVPLSSIQLRRTLKFILDNLRGFH
jgi:hypothetical protein